MLGLALRRNALGIERLIAAVRRIDHMGEGADALG
jgi:hypothetical protein